MGSAAYRVATQLFDFVLCACDSGSPCLGSAQFLLVCTAQYLVGLHILPLLDTTVQHMHCSPSAGEIPVSFQSLHSGPLS